MSCYDSPRVDREIEKEGRRTTKRQAVRVAPARISAIRPLARGKGETTVTKHLDFSIVFGAVVSLRLSTGSPRRTRLRASVSRGTRAVAVHGNSSESLNSNRNSKYSGSYVCIFSGRAIAPEVSRFLVRKLLPADGK